MKCYFNQIAIKINDNHWYNSDWGSSPLALSPSTEDLELTPHWLDNPATSLSAQADQDWAS